MNPNLLTRFTLHSIFAFIDDDNYTLSKFTNAILAWSSRGDVRSRRCGPTRRGSRDGGSGWDSRVFVKIELCLDFVDEIGDAGTINGASTQLGTTCREWLMKEGESSNGKRTRVNHVEVFVCAKVNVVNFLSILLGK
jgi:hypothetical protein